jgi:hypothetical protein
VEKVLYYVMWASSVFFKLLTRVNNHQLGENSPNLVTLGDADTARFGLLFYARSQAPIKIDAYCSGTPP